MKLFAVAVLTLFVWLSPAVAAVGESTPADVLRSTMTELADTMKARRAEFEADPTKLRAVVEELFLPRFDTEYAAMLMLGRAGRNATDDQKRQFITSFYAMLVNNYSEGLLQYREGDIEILSQRPRKSNGRETVRTRVTLDTGTVVPVDYRVRLTGGEWKVYDVVIEGVSYIRSQRAVVEERISQVGLVEFLAELEHKATAAGTKQ